MRLLRICLEGVPSRLGWGGRRCGCGQRLWRRRELRRRGRIMSSTLIVSELSQAAPKLEVTWTDSAR